MTPPELDDDHVVAICSALAEHDVAYVVIGGVAAPLHDTGHATVDIDVCPSRAKDNLARLATALRALSARLRVEGDAEGVAFEPHGDLLANVTTMTFDHNPRSARSVLHASGVRERLRRARSARPSSGCW